MFSEPAKHFNNGKCKSRSQVYKSKQSCRFWNATRLNKLECLHYLAREKKQNHFWLAELVYRKNLVSFHAEHVFDAIHMQMVSSWKFCEFVSVVQLSVVKQKETQRVAGKLKQQTE